MYLTERVSQNGIIVSECSTNYDVSGYCNWHFNIVIYKFELKQKDDKYIIYN